MVSDSTSTEHFHYCRKFYQTATLDKENRREGGKEERGEEKRGDGNMGGEGRGGMRRRLWTEFLSRGRLRRYVMESKQGRLRCNSQ